MNDALAFLPYLYRTAVSCLLVCCLFKGQSQVAKGITVLYINLIL